MARVHVLTTSDRVSRVVCHSSVGNGNNKVGTSWVDCMVASRRNVSQLEIGTLPGQITAAEHADIVAGVLFECSGLHDVDAGGSTGPQRKAALDAFADRLISESQEELRRRLDYWGHTQEDQ